MYTTIYLKGNYAPGGVDWIHTNRYQTSQEGVTVFTSTYGKEYKYFFPWCNVERIG